MQQERGYIIKIKYNYNVLYIKLCLFNFCYFVLFLCFPFLKKYEQIQKLIWNTIHNYLASKIPPKCETKCEIYIVKHQYNSHLWEKISFMKRDLD